MVKSNPNTIFKEWLRRGLKKSGKDKSELARCLDIHPSAIYKLLAGTRKFQLSEIKLMEDYLDEAAPKWR